MNEFDARLLDVTQNHVDLAALLQSLGAQGLIEHIGYALQLGSSAAPLLSGVMQSDVLAMQSDAWFVLQYVSSCVVRPDTPFWFTDSGNINLRITDTGAGEVLYSTPSSAGVLTATISRAQTGIPLLFPLPRIIPPNTNVKVDVTQLGVNVSDNQEPVGFWVFLGGSRIAMV